MRWPWSKKLDPIKVGDHFLMVPSPIPWPELRGEAVEVEVLALKDGWVRYRRVRGSEGENAMKEESFRDVFPYKEVAA